MKSKTIYKKAYSKWGKEFQIRMLFEEMAELTQTICHLERGRLGEKGFEKLVDEIVDVEIMLEQIKEIYLVPTNYHNTVKKGKLNRLEERVNSE